MQEEGLLFIIAGPSGVGKGTLCRRALPKLEGLELSVSCTTRAPRQGEAHGREYFFIGEDEYDRMIESNEFLEHAGVFGKRYGTPKGYVDKVRSAGRDVLLEIDVQGAGQVMANCPDAVSIFILPPDFRTLTERLVSRGTESKEQLALRLSKAGAEMLEAAKYDYIVVNDDLELSAQQIVEIIRAERLRTRNSASRLHAILKTMPEGEYDYGHD